MKEYHITQNMAEMDLLQVHGVIAQTYWSKGIPFDVFDKAVKNSLCFGVLTASGEQVGFARVITDKATFGYLADVYVLDAHQGQGLSKQLMQTIVEHKDLQGLRRFVLATRDAHGLYAQYGFSPIDNPEIFMQIFDPQVYQSS